MRPGLRRGIIGLSSAAVVVAGLVAGTPATASAAGAVDPALVGRHGDVRVVVQDRSGSVAAAEAAVRAAGGTVTRQLPIVRGFAATLPADAVARIARVPGVTDVSLDARMHVMGTLSPVDTLPSVFRKVVRGDLMSNAGYSGQGVTVALIDTGVDQNLPDLAGRVVPVTTNPLGVTTAPCENLSGEPDCTDNYGHGTFVAGLIAGNGASSAGQYVGLAPQANILSVKIAGRDGSADVSNVLAAIQWVVSFKNTYNIRVVNLSLGTDSTQSYKVDPLDYAVERAWNSGLAVVVSASNRGPAAGTISKPADDPYVITVGAIDDKGTVGTGDDELPNFTGRGPTAADGLAKPDVVAPGAHIVSLNAPGSAVDQNFATGMPAPYRRGSGTSFSAAIVSGAIADMVSATPSLSPDRIKYALMSTARQDASTDPMAVGAGLIDTYAATFNAPAGLADQGLTPSTGLGSLQASRGTTDVSVSTAAPLTGEVTAQLQVWDPVAYTTVDWNSSTWYSSTWYSSTWYSSTWYSSTWYSSTWYSSTWYGTPDSSTWYGSSWASSTWYGAWDQ